jgi:hypothetical protein
LKGPALERFLDIKKKELIAQFMNIPTKLYFALSSLVLSGDMKESLKGS